MVGRLRLSHRCKSLLVVTLLSVPVASLYAETDADGEATLAQRIGAGNVLAGKHKIESENCQECHGEEGVGISASAPKLAGQYADYIVKQLKDFQTGRRKHPVMNPMAEGLTEDDQADIAALYASKLVVRGEGGGASPVAQKLFQQGDPSRNLPSCKSCHGETGQGKFSPTECYPLIGGQHRIYLREQLLNWRKGERTNSTSNVMNYISKSLSDAEIDALAGYVSGL